jgi:aryl-alcohol dehydrogenase-like predicted oxidoreductase
MRRRLGGTDLLVFPWCLGGNVLGWTADERASFAVLDAYLGGGGNFVDTADMYSEWAHGNAGGESETIVGSWLHARGNRDDVVLATKVGKHHRRPGLSASNITRACEDSLRRLRTDHVDLYYAHEDDLTTPLEETLAAFDALVRAGKVRHVAASNITAERLAEALGVSDREGLARYVAVQPEYNLVRRDEYEAGLLGLCVREGLGVMPYYALAEGFLTGKYRRGGAPVPSERRDDALVFLDDRGERVLVALDAVAAAHGVTPAAVAVGWLLTRPGVVAPVASARTVEQVAELLPAVELQLSADDLARLELASAT